MQGFQTRIDGSSAQGYLLKPSIKIRSFLLKKAIFLGKIRLFNRKFLFFNKEVVGKPTL